MDEVMFELATVNDFLELLSMMEEFYAIDGYPFDRELTLANLKRYISSEQIGRIWIIRERSVVVGYLVFTFFFSFEFGGPTAFIDELFLKQDYRSKGLGGLAVDFASRKATELGLKALHLEVERHNEKGNRLYAKKGFTEHKRSLMTKMIR